MKKLLSISILILGLYAAVFAQTNQNPPCPTIKVFGPWSVPQTGDTISFSAKVEGIELTNLTYNWTVTTGEIIKGQGTSVIEVQSPKEWKESLTATVEVKGFPDGCPNVEGETIPCGLTQPEAVKLMNFH